MSRRSVVLLAALGTIAATLVAIRNAATVPPPGSGYQWVQPDCAPVTTPRAQPPAWIPITPALTPPPGSTYAGPSLSALP
jgi:hypothetical protein